MSVRADEQTIYLEGRCRLEDAEALLTALLQAPDRPIDVSAADILHTAVIQLVLASDRRVEGEWRDSFLDKFVVFRPPQGNQEGTGTTSPTLS
jgi:hypothetical protein